MIMIFMSSLFFGLSILILMFKAQPHLVAAVCKLKRMMNDKIKSMRRIFLRKSFQKQEVEFVNQIAGGLSAGLSLEQSFALSVDEMKDPFKGELKRILAEVKLGKTIAEELFELGKILKEEDILVIAHSLDVLCGLGGNLVAKFKGLADLICERERVVSKIKSQQAQGKMQGFLLASLPLALLAVLYSIAPKYVSPLFDTTLGAIIMFISILWEIAGVVVMLNITRIKV